MRAGGCTVQQALAPEAAVVVKQAVSLARRRGNAQVTPLHVASAMLHQQAAAAAATVPPPPPSTGLLRAACLRSHSHPLQCKALELCFNVALNRLPTSASPLLGGHGGHVYYPPSLSNALVAAFKRAQAHQRRGSVDAQQQQQPVLAVKIELEQLVISILDDPSVSRVMREAGFSSTQVKANVEQAVVSSIEANSSASTTAAAGSTTAAPQNPSPSGAAPCEETKPSKLLPPPLSRARDEDVAAILDCLASRSKRRVMVVAECAASAEASVQAAVEKVKRGEALRGARVVSLRVSRFRGLPRNEAEQLLVELRCAVKVGGRAGGGVVLVVEDLGWAAEFWAARAAVESGRGASRWPASSCCYYCAVEHAVAEVRALACRGGDGVWLVGCGTYQSYMRCRAGQPSLESLWGLQTLAVPAGSLALSLSFVDDDSLIDVWQTGITVLGKEHICRRTYSRVDWGYVTDETDLWLSISLACSCAPSINHRPIMAKCDDDRSGNASASRCMSLFDAGGGSGGHLTTAAVSSCCGDCDCDCDCSAIKCDAKKALPRPVAPSSSIPSWLQHCRDHQEQPSISCKKISTCGGSPSHHRRTALNFSTVVLSPSSSSVSSYEQQHHHHLHHQPYQPWLVAAAAAHESNKHPWKQQATTRCVHDGDDVKLVSVIKVKSHDSSASNGSVEQVERRCSRFKELNAENLKLLCSALEQEVPWHAEIMPDIASTVLRCRSGMARRRRHAVADDVSGSSTKEDTWMLFHGGDREGKARVARELACLAFGSRKSFVSIGGAAASPSSPATWESAEQQQQHKRPRSTEAASSRSHGCHEGLYEAVRDNPHRVIMVEDIDQAGQGCQAGILEAIESGLVRSHGGDEAAALGDAIVVLSCESFDAWSRTSSPPTTKRARIESEEEPKEDQDHKEAITAAGVSSPSSSSFDLNLSVENEDMEESCFADAGLVQAVDRAFFFRRPDESSD
ncbi:hypothetical protein U9M48_023221 [Paspalum notatum var. saurae]|uniref:Clp R domain-containing protein n=1 Tax=Paspalum notatum var. saurae TaxID=547442 RepID=A0AAQ3TJD6_PASNO